METLALHTGTPKVHWEDNTSFISGVEAKIVTPRFKHIDIPVYFLQENLDNGLFIPKYEKYSVILADMCTKPCSGPITNLITKWMPGLIFYTTSDTEHYQLLRLHYLVVN